MSGGWAFLVARGRRQGFRARLVPAVLAEHGLAGLVEENRPADTPAGRATPVTRTHRIRPEDVGSPNVLDEHGRPLDVSYGFVHLDPLAEVDEADLATALGQALDTYRRFLADETGFETEVSAPFALRSRSAATRTTARRPLRSAPPAGRARTTAGLLAAGLLAAVLAAIFIGVRGAGGPAGDDLTGTWQDETFTVTVTCEPGCPVPAGTAVGTARAAACTYRLVLAEPADGALRTAAGRTAGVGCLADGPLSLRRTADDRASLEWHDAAGNLLRRATLRPAGS
ncbi:hypothetical protein RB614_42760 [Phytohabitans sp. ZYX-F-186]|uniref:Uncharacterized protein n=1 Tax=Phytohabitans maris TaxID=3071409 RepID=A0ABU0ZW67_9ACTN|nr:hypothetical protein [Phytohabitans sp. ZYX-F-186]MDQ7911232.1 hypothetical protein [Phytohabitans sp. ZYX-F-186]